MPFRRLAASLLAATVALAGAAEAGVAGPGKARLSATKVTGPPKGGARAGDRVAIRAVVRNSGRRAGRSAVKVIVPRRPGAGAGRTLAEAPARRFPRGSRRGVQLSFEVGHALAPRGSALTATHRLAVCVRAHGGSSRFRCREAKRPLRVKRPPLPPEFKAGGRSAGDPLFPQVGNTGYDVTAYDIDLAYNPATNRLTSGTRTAITATATRNLGELSLDFQNLDVASVRVNGEPAAFGQVPARPAAPRGTRLRKLVIRPAAGIRKDETFRVSVRYSGEPVPIVDPDGTTEGWVRACVGLPTPLTCDGALVVSEPNGAQGWFPGNHHPSDKATVSTSIVVPASHTALGVGELVSRENAGHGRRRWNWVEDDPTATYLMTGTVGRFAFEQSSITETGAGRTLPAFTAIASVANPVQRASIDAALGRTEGMVNFLAGQYGAYPFDSAGAIVDRVPGLGYALEVQTKPAFTTLNVPVSTLLHEYAHQWFGNAVTPATWLDVWFSEGWAQWSEWHWGFQEGGAERSPAGQFQDHYASASAYDWSVPPATLKGNPANLFAYFPVYVRSAMTLQGYRQIVGHARFLDFARELQDRYAYGNVTTEEVIALAKELSGLAGPDLALLGEYFRQWLYRPAKPTILPSDF